MKFVIKKKMCHVWREMKVSSSYAKNDGSMLLRVML
jgi:hypothetical protein